jgi:hypothetical protein
LIDITSSEVPTATGIGKPRVRTSAGTTTKPPPTPKKPVSSPTAVATTSTLAARGHAQMNDGRNLMIGPSSSADRDTPASRRLRANITAATMSMSNENAANRTSGATFADSSDPT